jgi:hypothetical protein
MRFPETDLPDVVYMQYLTGAHYIDKPEEVERYAAVMERLSVAGTSPSRAEKILSAGSDPRSRAERKRTS